MKYTSKRLTVIFFLAHHFYPCALRALRSGAISDISLVYKRKFCLAAMRQASATCGGSRKSPAAAVQNLRFYPQRSVGIAANSVKHLRLYLT